ncbi:MAG: hypothetical protein LC730_04870 [Acidobacteria bacterium]|nr:hypothetical protein [Acidobacteriota bacterium]MCA1608777.1 hypothetical protein [Acidobacteriota bacterium]
MIRNTMLMFVTLTLAAYFYDLSSYARGASSVSNSVKIEVRAEKSTYVLGELVTLNLALRNDGSNDVLLAGVNAQSGYVRIWLSDADGKFREYSNAAWGSKKTSPRTLKPGEKVSSSATVLANSKPDVSHLSEDWARQTSEDRIMTSYAFPKAGIYYIKAVLIIPGEVMTKIESDPIQITIEEPVGENSEVWNKTKNRGDFAYFIQEGQVIASTEEKKRKFLQEVHALVESFPNSSLANQIQKSYAVFRANEEKRLEMLEKVKRQNPSN